LIFPTEILAALTAGSALTVSDWPCEDQAESVVSLAFKASSVGFNRSATRIA
jgi:hypothetical protein